MAEPTKPEARHGAVDVSYVRKVDGGQLMDYGKIRWSIKSFTKTDGPLGATLFALYEWEFQFAPQTGQCVRGLGFAGTSADRGAYPDLRETFWEARIVQHVRDNQGDSLRQDHGVMDLRKCSFSCPDDALDAGREIAKTIISRFGAVRSVEAKGTRSISGGGPGMRLVTLEFMTEAEEAERFIRGAMDVEAEWARAGK